MKLFASHEHVIDSILEPNRVNKNPKHVVFVRSFSLRRPENHVRYDNQFLGGGGRKGR